LEVNWWATAQIGRIPQRDLDFVASVDGCRSRRNPNTLLPIHFYQKSVVTSERVAEPVAQAPEIAFERVIPPTQSRL
jgi:hypothetical protein